MHTSFAARFAVITPLTLGILSLRGVQTAEALRLPTRPSCQPLTDGSAIEMDTLLVD
jgi:hypothetical protein